MPRLSTGALTLLLWLELPNLLGGHAREVLFKRSRNRFLFIAARASTARACAGLTTFRGGLGVPHHLSRRSGLNQSGSREYKFGARCLSRKGEYVALHEIRFLQRRAPGRRRRCGPADRHGPRHGARERVGTSKP